MSSTTNAATGVRKLLIWMFPANISLFLLWGAIPAILLPLQVQAVDPDNRATNLALVSTIGALAAMLAQPLAGTLSDRTRSRYGARAPWIAGGTLIGGLALLGMASANTLLQIGISWTIVQIGFNFVQGPMSAIAPDRVPVQRRGAFSAVVGFASMAGSLGGQIIGTGFAERIGTGYVTFAGIAVLGIGLLLLLNPDRDNRDEPRRPFDLAAFARSYWFNPRKHPDLGWAFLSRLLLYLGYFLIINYQLYILQDHIGLGDDAVSFIPIVGTLMLVATLITTAVGGPLSDRAGRRKPFVYAAAVLCAAGLVGPWLLPTQTGMLIFAVVTGLGFGLFGSVDQALVTQVLPAKDDFAKDLGVVNFAATLPQMLAPAIAGGVVALAGYATLFPVAIVLMLLGGLAVAPVKTVR